MMLRQLPLALAATALATLGCSDAPARPAKLGLYMKIENPTTPEAAGRQCPTSTGVEWDIGKPVKDKTTGMIIDVESPSPTSFGETIEDGKSGVNLKCTVRKSGSFTSDGGGTDPQITAPGGIINFRMNGTAKKSGTSATNLITTAVYTPRTLSISSNPGYPRCFISAVHEQAPGALWADYDCPALTDVTSPDIACRASGTIVMEYCKTGEEED